MNYENIPENSLSDVKNSTIVVFWCKFSILPIGSLSIRHHEASIEMWNNYPYEDIFEPNNHSVKQRTVPCLTNIRQVAQRATIAHLSPMCQVMSHLKLEWRHHFPIITLWNILNSRVTNSAISVRICPKLELVQDFMHVFVTCKFKEDQTNSNRETVETSIF